MTTTINDKIAVVKLQRYENNPIISPNLDNYWEDYVTTNPGAWYDESAGKIYMLYRAAGDDDVHRIWFGLAVSEDGFNFRRVSDEPVFGPSENGWDAGCVEDPRIVKMGDWYYVTYAARTYTTYFSTVGYGKLLIPEDIPEEAPWAVRVAPTVSGLAMTRDFKKWIRCGRITSPTCDDRDTILFPEKINGKFYLLHRPGIEMRSRGSKRVPSIRIACSDDLLEWKDSRVLARGAFDWEGGKVGANCPPIKTPYGWLVIYHGVSEHDLYYRLGAMLLKLDDPCVVTHRTPEYIFEPEEWYELDGIYKGVCFPCGSIVKDGKLFVYYGGADRYCALATCQLSELLDYLLANPWDGEV